MGDKVLMKGNEALAEAAIMAGCRHYFGYPITPQTEVAAYLAKRMPQVDGTFLMQLMRTEHFHAVGLFSAGQLAGEILVAGNGPQAELVAFYVSQPFRRRGIGTAMCRWALWTLSLEGVRVAGARFVTRSLPQKALAKALGASETATTAVFPQLFM